MQYHKSQAFSVAELLISLAIILLLAMIAVFQLDSSKQKDELHTAARQLAADIRSMQSRALAAQNIKACPDGADLRVCEYSESLCAVGTCEEKIPHSFGIHLEQGLSSYSTFADFNPIPAGDNILTDDKELILSRTLLGASSNVTISTLQSATSGSPSPPQTEVDISFIRQNGTAHIVDSTLPPEPSIIIITLSHLKTGDVAQIEVNRITGRVSIL